MLKRCICTVILMLTALVLNLSASTNLLAEVKIGVVNVEKAIALSHSGKKAQKELEEQRQDEQQELDKKKNQFETQKKAFDKQKDSLNEQARIEKEEKLLSSERELTRSFRDAQEKLRRRGGAVLKDLVKDLRIVIEEVGRSEGYTVILDKSGQGVVYNSEEVDLTDLVVEKFNKRTGKK